MCALKGILSWIGDDIVRVSRLNNYYWKGISEQQSLYNSFFENCTYVAFRYSAWFASHSKQVIVSSWKAIYLFQVQKIVEENIKGG